VARRSRSLGRYRPPTPFGPRVCLRRRDAVVTALREWLQIVVIEEQIRIAAMMSLVMHDARGLDAVGSLALCAFAERALVEQPMTEPAPACAAIERASEVTVAIQAARLFELLAVDGTAATGSHRARTAEDDAGLTIRRGVVGCGCVSHW
jgi:hypothetical protein